MPRSAASPSRGLRIFSVSKKAAPGARKSSSVPGDCSSSGSRNSSRSCSSSRICNGPTPRWSSSSPTFSSGRGTTRSSSSASPAPSCRRAIPSSVRPHAPDDALPRAAFRNGDGGSPRGVVPGLPAEIREQILARAEGVPLYAVETVRMLLDRGLVAEADGVYEPTGPIEELEVPETLQGLIAARLDGLAPEERRVLQDASVLGKTFSKEALAVALRVVRRRARCRCSRRWFARRSWESRQIRAHRSEGSTDSSRTSFVAWRTTRSRARSGRPGTWRPRHSSRELRRGGAGGRRGRGAPTTWRRTRRSPMPMTPTPLDRAPGSLSARESGQGHLPRRRGAEVLRAGGRAFGRAAREGASSRAGGGHGRRQCGVRRGGESVLRRTRAPGQPTQATPRPACRAGSPMSKCSRGEANRPASGSSVLSQPWPRTSPTPMWPTLHRASLSPTPSPARTTSRRAGRARARGRPGPPPPGDADPRSLGRRRLLARAGGRPEEELAFQRHAVRYALEHDLSASTTTAYGNLSDACFQRDRYGEAFEVLQEALTHARRVGDRRNELYLLSEMSYTLTMTGRWEEALADYTELPEERASPRRALASVLSGVLEIYLHRGQQTEARELLSVSAPSRSPSTSRTARSTQQLGPHSSMRRAASTTH